MTADEIRLLDNADALLFIRGERPIIDKKYDILKHPNVKYTKDGKAAAYRHGLITHNIENWQDIELSEYEYELYSEADIEEYLAQLEENGEKLK